MHTDRWRVEEKQYSCPVVMRGSDTNGDLEIVAKCYGIEGHKASEIANLVAAAPKLLWACKDALEYFMHTGHGADWRQGGGVEHELLAAAIAEAEGRVK